MKQIDKISIKELKELSEKMYGSLVKAVVDIETAIQNKIRAIIAEVVYE